MEISLKEKIPNKQKSLKQKCQDKPCQQSQSRCKITSNETQIHKKIQYI